VFRHVSVGATPLHELGLPPVLASLAMEPRGLVLVTGPTGSGKTTTLSGMVDHINSSKEVHIVTVEDPIEVLHYDKLAMVNQREVRVDTEDFVSAMRAAMRQDPTSSSSARCATTRRQGRSRRRRDRPLRHVDAAHHRRRRDDPPRHRLLPAARAEAGAPGAGRVAARHRLPAPRCPRPTASAAASSWRSRSAPAGSSDAIAEPEKTSSIPQLIAEGGYYGMQTFDQHLVQLVQAGTVTLADAMAASTSPHDLTVQLRQPRPRRLTPPPPQPRRDRSPRRPWANGSSGVVGVRGAGLRRT
jgi:twitching motility protein PilT